MNYLFNHISEKLYSHRVKRSVHENLPEIKTDPVYLLYTHNFSL